MAISRVRALLSAVLFASFATHAFAHASDGFIAPDPQRPAVGEWMGQVSWNDPIVAYAWARAGRRGAQRAAGLSSRSATEPAR